LAGFSFGSSVAARASYLVQSIEHLTLVAPPIERYEYDQNSKFPAPLCVIQGDKDERLNAQGVYEWVQSLAGCVELIRYSEAGHFFHGFLSPLKSDLTATLVRQIRQGF
jgi:alpha/beta superfamily hydrolase